MEDSIFTKIIKGEIPGQTVYEDDQCVVLMSIEPINPGHCMVVPRQQIDSLWDTEDPLYTHLLAVAKLMAKRMENAYDYQRIGMLVEGFGVPHAHIHIFGYTQPMEQTMARQLEHKHMVSQDELAAEAAKLRA